MEVEYVVHNRNKKKDNKEEMNLRADFSGELFAKSLSWTVVTTRVTEDQEDDKLEELQLSLKT